MSGISKIIVPTDFSEASCAALNWVERLVTGDDVEVHCINVVQEPMMYMPVASAGAPMGGPGTDELQHIATESLDSFTAQHCGDLGGTLVKKVLVGRPAVEISSYAKDISADIIVISTHGHSALEQLMLGSTTEGVVRRAECAVLTVRD